MTTLPFPLSEEPDDFARERGRLLFADKLGIGAPALPTPSIALAQPR